MDRLRLMAVHAHPHDESIRGAATLARYVAEGVEVIVVTCTSGERGHVLHAQLRRRPNIHATLGAVRRREMARAQRILGIRHSWLGYPDSGSSFGSLPPGCFAALDPIVPAAALVRLVRQFRPHVMLTYDENGGYPHPDHVMTHRVAVAAFASAGDADAFPGTGEPWQPRKLYFDRSFSKARAEAEDRALRSRGITRGHPAWIEEYGPIGREYSTRIWCADWFPIRQNAIAAHATQSDPRGEWFAVPLEVQRMSWPTEEFLLARSMVAVRLPEDDLFTGLRPRPRPLAAQAAGARTQGRTS